MVTLYERLSERTNTWRQDGFPHDTHPAIAEILEWAEEAEDGELRYLRRPQLRALEAYWYLRLVEDTPHIRTLYERCFPPETDTTALLEAMGVPEAAFRDANYRLQELWERTVGDDRFAKQHQLHTLRETLTLDYPSYILALAMGAGKTVLMAAIFATEFAMAMEYPDGPFVQNALVFAPGKTIIQSLRELTVVPYDRILPPRMHKPFAASLKLTFTRDGERDVPVIRGSAFNVVVTNTEKIRIRKETIRKGDVGPLQGELELDEAKREVANLRLQTIASLPHLAVFSDEAHHTYGQSLEKDLKKVRMTVDYLAEKTNLICVVNTTGTPYFKRQPLRDVVVWYGLSQGIADDILKDLSGNIHGYDLDGNAGAFVQEVVRDFLGSYRDVRLPNGAPAKMAMYFPQIDDLDELRPVVERSVVGSGIDPSVILVNTSASPPSDVEAFNRLNDPASPHRIILLVNKGTEGWNCPSLFACALARRLKTSNNFVLQAASRCLRQVPGNTASARVYLSMDNYAILDKQLTETYGETIEDLRGASVERIRRTLVVRKPDIPPIRIRQVRRYVVRADDRIGPIELERPTAGAATITRRTFTLAEARTSRRVLQQVDDTVEIDAPPDTIDVRSVAVDLAATYRVPIWDVLGRLTTLYEDGEVPLDHVGALCGQIEDQTRAYQHHEEQVEVALALVKPEGFAAVPTDDGLVYTTEIVYPKAKEHLLVPMERLAGRNRSDFGFHYDPYNFDSRPEEILFEDIVTWANLSPDDVDEVLFTGAISDPGKTDFAVEYRDHKGRWRRYTPDFVVRRKDGRTLIIEVKGENMRDDPVNGEHGAKAMAVRALVDMNPGDLAYEILFSDARAQRVTHDGAAPVRTFIGLNGGDSGTVDRLRIPVDGALLKAFCEKWGIVELAFFGSVLREDFGPDSDVDVLVTFAPDVRIGWDIVEIQEELGSILGRKVDLATRTSVEEDPNWERRSQILDHLEVFSVG